MTRRLILLTFAVFSLATLYAQTSTARDSVLLRLDSMPHNEERLKRLADLILAASDNLEECGRINDRLLAEATEQDNDHYLCEAYYTRIFIAYNSYDVETLRRNVDLLLPLARETKNYDLLFRGWRCSIDFMNFTQDYEQSEKQGWQMLLEAQRLNNTLGMVEAKQCLANVFQTTFRLRQAIEILEETLPLAEKLGKIQILTNSWQPLLFLYSATHEYENWLHLLHNSEAHILRLKGEELRQQGLTLLIIYTSFADYYNQTGDLDQAKHYLTKAKAYTSDISSPLYTIFHNRICAQYFFRSGQYTLALERINLALEEMGTRMQGDDYLDMMLTKAHTLRELGHPGDALPLYKQAQAVKDSLQSAAIDKQNEQLKKDFRANQLLLEQARLRQQLQLYTLLLLIVGLATIVGFVFYALRNHRALKKAEAEMRSVTRKMKTVNEAKNRFLSNISATIREPLNTVVEGSLRLAAHQVEDPAEEQALSAQIRSMSAGLLKMINDILDLSRLESGMMKFETTDAEISSMLLDAVCAVETPENKIEIKAEYPANSLYMVRLDAGRLQQVFRSLLTAAGSDGIVVSIREQWQGLRIAVVGSSLANDSTSQDVIIRNEINRMLIVHLQGSYKIGRENGLPAIIIFLPVNEVLKPE